MSWIWNGMIGICVVAVTVDVVGEQRPWRRFVLVYLKTTVYNLKQCSLRKENMCFRYFAKHGRSWVKLGRTKSLKEYMRSPRSKLLEEM